MRVQRETGRRRPAAWLLICLLLLGTFCSGIGALAEEKTYETLADFAGQKMASQTGTVFDAAIDLIVDNVEHLYYNDIPSQAEAVVSGRAIGCALDEPVARLLVATRPELAIFPEVIEPNLYGFAFRKGDPIVDKVSEVILRFAEDGTADEMAARWFSADDSVKQLPVLDYKEDFDGSEGTLRFGYDPVVEPMVYLGEGAQPLGYDIEAMMRIAYELNMTLELVPTNLSARIEALLSGATDVAGCCMTITEERKQSVDFAAPYYDGGMVLVVRKENMPGGAAGAADGINTPADLTGHKVGILTGSVYDKIVYEQIPGAIPEYYNNFTDMIEALKIGHIDGYITDEPLARVSVSRVDGIRYLPEHIMPDAYAFFFGPTQTELHAAFNRELKAMWDDGTIAKLDEKWFSLDESRMVLDPIELTGENGTLRLAVDPSTEPFSYLSHEQIIGSDIEIARIICQRLGYGLEIITSDFAGIVPGVVSGKYDMAAGSISISPERAEQGLFSDPTYLGGVVAVVRAESTAEALGFWESLKVSFDKTFVVENRYKLILNGLGVTIIISVASVFFGTILGFGVCMMRRSRRGILRVPAQVFIRIIQGIPMVVMLLILAYVVFRRSQLDPVWIAVIAFSINFAAYVSEMMRTGIDAVDPGQLEAAAALGFGKLKIFTKITFPQAARHTLPVYKGEIISMVKASAIVGYIAIQDLTKASDIIRSRTFEAFFPLIATAVIYFLLAYLLTALLTLLERAIDPKRRKRTLKGVTLK